MQSVASMSIIDILKKGDLAKYIVLCLGVRSVRIAPVAHMAKNIFAKVLGESDNSAPEVA